MILQITLYKLLLLSCRHFAKLYFSFHVVQNIKKFLLQLLWLMFCYLDLCCLQIFVYFLAIFLVLISNLIALWSANIFYMIPILVICKRLSYSPQCVHLDECSMWALRECAFCFHWKYFTYTLYKIHIHIYVYMYIYVRWSQLICFYVILVNWLLCHYVEPLSIHDNCISPVALIKGRNSVNSCLF